MWLTRNPWQALRRSYGYGASRRSAGGWRIAARHFLIVDDDANDAAWLARHITKAGHTADTALDGPQAIALCRARRYDTAFVDLNLPGMNGWQFLEQLRLTALDTNRVIVTGAERLDQIPPSEYFGIIRKPVSFEALQDCIRRP